MSDSKENRNPTADFYSKCVGKVESHEKFINKFTKNCIKNWVIPRREDIPETQNMPPNLERTLRNHNIYYNIKEF